MAKSPAEIQSLARSHCPRAIHVLRGIMNNTKSPPAARIQAASALLDRGLGKPHQAVAVDVSVAITKIERRIVDPLVIEHDDAAPILDITTKAAGTGL